MSNTINRSIKVNKHKVKNRIIMPPVVCFNWTDNDGFEIIDRADHYGKRAKGGTGMIIIESSSISKDVRICDTELGIWKDEHIPQFERIAKSCHDEGAVVIVQLMNAGKKALGKTVYSSSPVEIENKECLEMPIQMIEKVKKDHVAAALRAKKAGLDGIEIHGAHGYLLSQLTSKEVNKRTDSYGGSLDNRLRLSLEIVHEIRQAVGEDFIICYRLGANDPTMEEDKYFAKKLEEAGVDILNVSVGIGADSIVVPEEFKLSAITYMGTVIHQEVNIPVACVFGIREAKEAEYLLENNLIDMVAVGRGLLADPDWTNKAIKGEDINKCYHCRTGCKYHIDGRKCPWYNK
ncbi:tRNA-dihydrouridine synthase [Oceanirhabdus seepicola]|uniref:NADH:flavin oxidoreductase n=1 Tax=Oceanirhabdus seepicola TaxID=2828781 RepID=A0A9J6P6B4_9CLOT|nr:NADH:flavin oxidoreductase [Oceanirhabdus seepicola]MCM1991804.1 NADH:flavin oxidoreductase [Oceanirhabdus seepicola]